MSADAFQRARVRSLPKKPTGPNQAQDGVCAATFAQPAGHYGKLRDWQIAEAEDDEAALSLFCLARAGAAATRPVSA
jgi:hypothetical protein